MNIKEKRDVFFAIADPNRRKILDELRKSKELALHELTSHFDMGRTAESKHLTILKDAGLVWSKKVGKETRYRINPNPLKVVNDWVGFYEEFWLSRLEKLEEV